jgi:hypothetical protein
VSVRLLQLLMPVLLVSERVVRVVLSLRLLGRVKLRGRVVVRVFVLPAVLVVDVEIVPTG